VRALLVSSVALVALVSCGGGEPGVVTGSAARVFTPREVTVAAGDTVTWEIEGDEAHTVTAYEDDLPEGAEYFATGGFGTEEAARDEIADGLISGGETFEFTFDQPGTYRYYCIPHEGDGMVGTIVVE